MRPALTTVLTLALLAAGLTGCGRDTVEDARADAEHAIELAAGLGPEATALALLGYEPEELTDEEASPPSGRWRTWQRRHAERIAQRQRLLHGEVVVQTEEGPRTVLVQRGEVSEVTETTVTVASRDGFRQTWTYGQRLRVREARATIAPQELAAGVTVAVAGHDRDGTPVANLVVIPDQRKTD